MKYGIGFAVFVALQASAQPSAPVEIKAEGTSLAITPHFQQDPKARYRLFRTRNHWTFLELDTNTGRLWQVQYTVNEQPAGRFPVNTQALAENGRPGRFTLYETNNIWNYILVDQDTGALWQAQFSMDDEKAPAGIMRLRDLER